MKVREVREAIEGLGDDAEVVLHVDNLDCISYISAFEDIDFRLDRVKKRDGGRSGLIIIAHAFDSENDDDGDDDDGEFPEGATS